jgi:hypothetical protein
VRREKHNGYVIIARGLLLKNGKWSAQFDIEKHLGSGVISTPIDILGMYESEEAAIEAAILHGRKRINDGFQPDHSISAPAE